MAIVLFPAFLICCFPVSSSAASGPVEPENGGLIDLSMYRDPELADIPVGTTFHPRLKSLWLLALQRPDLEVRRRALQAFTEAKGLGMDGLEDIAPPVTKVLTEDADSAVRAAAAATLAALDDPAAGDALLQASERPADREIAPLVDPALARWKHQPAVTVWQRRVADGAEPLMLRVSAARSLGQIGAAGAVETLTSVAVDSVGEAAIRIEAAGALAKVAPSGLAPRATELAAGATLDRLVAARMLAGHKTGDANTLLNGLITDPAQDPAVVAEAARSLLAISPAELAKQAEVLIKHPDPGARRVLAHALLQLPQDDRQPHALAIMLDDPDVEVRHTAREGILAAAAAGQDVGAAVSAALAGGGDAPLESGAGKLTLGPIGWRGLEQAAFIVGKLDHEASADRLIGLLRHDRPEVRVAAASALRQLAVPATLPAMLARAQELAQATTPVSEATDAAAMAAAAQAAGEESTQLFMAFGEMKFAEADALARTYIPKDSPYYPMARGAAVYALGKLHEGTLDEPLARQLASRLSDINPMQPEMTEVRRFSAIALGRMKAEAQLGPLRQFYQEEMAAVDVGGACRWAIIQITGEELPPIEVGDARQTGFFLEPAD